MPPYCCGGRTCAKDLKGDNDGGGGENGGEKLITVTEAETPLTLKFYARHDWPYYNCTDEEIARMRKKFEKKQDGDEDDDEEDEDGMRKPYVPKHKTPQPMTENQVYGWYQHRAYRYLKHDRGIFIFPREGDELIKTILACKGF